MKRIKLYILVLIACLINDLPLQGMLTSKYAALKRAAARKVAVTRAAQKRTLYTPEKLKGLYTPLTTKAQKVAPLHGAIEFETGAIQRRYEVESQAFGPQLVQELFFQQGPQFKPTVNKSKAAYALSPEIIGLVIGALETGRLQEEKVRNYIIDQWQNEYRKITDEKKPFSRGKIEKLLRLIEAEYDNNTESCRNILLGFLYVKALPDNDHDMIHYLAGLNEFINVFADQSSSAAQSLKAYVAEKKGTTQPEPTFFEKLQSGVQAVKNYMSGSSSNVYEQKDYDALKTTLQKGNRQKKVEKVLKEKFELTISAMLKEKTSSSLYPPKVVQSSYGYKGQPPASDCVETALHGLLNIILYNPQLRSFDLSLLPSALTLNENFKQFYSTYNVNKINTQEYGQAFMDLVSGVDGVAYKRGNYELAANETEKNLLTLMNYFFGINAQTLNELGAMLSDEQRTITFTGPTQGKKSIEINMNIENRQTGKTQQAIFCFEPGHGWIEVPDMNVLEGKSLFDPVELAESYRINPEVKTLLRIEPTGHMFLMRKSELPEKLSKSFYYALPVETDNEKQSTIRRIKDMGIDNIDKEAFDYAFHLYQQLPSDEQEDIFLDMLAMGMKEEIWRSHAKFKKFVVDNYDKALKKIISKASSAEEYINFVKELYKEFPDDLSKYKFMIYALGETINTKILDTHLIEILYEQIVNNQYKKNFLADLLLIFVNYPELAKKINIVAIAEKCINDGVDIKGNAISTSSTVHATYSTAPLVSAIRMGNVPLVELLVDSGISINAPLKYKKSGPLVMNATPLWITELEKNSLEEDNKMTEFLLVKGANPNSTLKLGPISSYLINQAISSFNKDKVNLLLKHGVNVNIRDSSEETPLDVFNENKNKFSANDQKEIREALLSAGAKTSAELLKENIEESVIEDKQRQLNIE